MKVEYEYIAKRYVGYVSRYQTLQSKWSYLNNSDERYK